MLFRSDRETDEAGGPLASPLALAGMVLAIGAITSPIAMATDPVGDRLIRQEIGRYCEQIDPEKTNFECEVVTVEEAYGREVPYLDVRWIKPQNAFPDHRQGELRAEVERLLLRYMQLSGGRCASIYKKYDPDGTVNCCPKKGEQPDFACYPRN